MSTIQSDAPESMSATLVERFERRYARYRFAVVVMETRFGREWRSVWTGKRFSVRCRWPPPAVLCGGGGHPARARGKDRHGSRSG